MNFFQWIAKLVSEYWRQFLSGTVNTLVMAIVGTAVGFIIGLLIAIVRTVPVAPGDGPLKKAVLKTANVIMTGYIEVIRGMLTEY